MIISDSQSDIDLQKTFSELKSQPWCKELDYDSFRISVQNSYCLVGKLSTGEQTSFLRLITDYRTFGYITDVITFEQYRGNGYSKQLLDYLFKHSPARQVKEFFLIADPLGVYSHYDFKPFRYRELFYSRSPKNSGEYELSPIEYYSKTEEN